MQEDGSRGAAGNEPHMWIGVNAICMNVHIFLYMVYIKICAYIHMCVVNCVAPIAAQISKYHSCNKVLGLTSIY